MCQVRGVGTVEIETDSYVNLLISALDITRIMRLFSITFLLTLIAANVCASDNYPGLPPDCWSESRIVHGSFVDQELFDKSVKIEAVEELQPITNKIYSTNKGYWFSKDGVRPEVVIQVDSEKDHLVNISIKDVNGVSDEKWINEKLIFFRIWWGRIMATDVIFDVEDEAVIYSEPAMDGFLAYQQYQESCRVHGCSCIEKE
jgi:hypothetical protein